jgi:hypothetical protein
MRSPTNRELFELARRDAESGWPRRFIMGIGRLVLSDEPLTPEQRESLELIARAHEVRP